MLHSVQSILISHRTKIMSDILATTITFVILLDMQLISGDNIIHLDMILKSHFWICCLCHGILSQLWTGFLYNSGCAYTSGYAAYISRYYHTSICLLISGDTIILLDILLISGDTIIHLDILLISGDTILLSICCLIRG